MSKIHTDLCTSPESQDGRYEYCACKMSSGI